MLDFMAVLICMQHHFDVAICTRHLPPKERLLLVRSAQRGSLEFVGTSRLHCGHCRPVRLGKCFGRVRVIVSRGVNQPLLHGTSCHP